MEFDWLVESLADLGGLIRSLTNFPLPLDFFLGFFGVGEMWSAMGMSVRRRKDTRQSQGICHFVQLPRGRGAASEARASDKRFRQGPVDISGHLFPITTFGSLQLMLKLLEISQVHTCT